MQLPGPGVFGPPRDRRRADVPGAGLLAGVDHIDTAQYYGPDVANERSTLRPPVPTELVIVSVGALR
jgi:diketogulonate reductase-like aldo/keto reductase